MKRIRNLFKKNRFDIMEYLNKPLDPYSQLWYDFYEEERKSWIDFIKFNQKEVSLQFIKEHPKFGLKEENIKWENTFLDVLERKDNKE